MTTPWCVIQVQPAAERKVATSIRDAGIEAYVPIERVWRWGQRRTKHRVERPLIRGYVFAAMSKEDQGIVATLEGAKGLLGYDPVLERAAKVPAKFIDRLKEAEAAGDYDKTKPAKQKVWTVGERAVIKRGAWKGHVATIGKLKPQRRVDLLLSLFGRPTIGKASLDDLVIENSEEALALQRPDVA